MYQILNQYSLVIVGLGILIAIAVFTWRFVGKKYVAAISGLIIALLVGLQLLFSTDANTYKNVTTFDNAITSGNPVILVFYSDF